MKKVFKLSHEKKAPERVVEGIKNEIRKYIKREKRKSLPDGADYWKFECKFGKDNQNICDIGFVDITKNIDEAFNENCECIYVEIMATKGKREPKVKPVIEGENEETLESEDEEIVAEDEIENEQDLEQEDKE